MVLMGEISVNFLVISTLLGFGIELDMSSDLLDFKMKGRGILRHLELDQFFSILNVLFLDSLLVIHMRVGKFNSIHWIVDCIRIDETDILPSNQILDIRWQIDTVGYTLDSREIFLQHIATAL